MRTWTKGQKDTIREYYYDDLRYYVTIKVLHIRLGDLIKYSPRLYSFGSMRIAGDLFPATDEGYQDAINEGLQLHIEYLRDTSYGGL